MYSYQTQKPNIFTEDGQTKFLAIRDNVHKLLKQSGAVRMSEAISKVSGDTWDSLACIDRLVELKEIRELTSSTVCGQDRVFVSARG